MEISFVTKEESEFSDRVYRNIDERNVDLAQQIIDECIERTDNLNKEAISAQVVLKRDRLLDASSIMTSKSKEGLEIWLD